MKLLKPNTSTFSKQLKIMALTTEQIKKLKFGDPIIISTVFDGIDSVGDIWFRFKGGISWFVKPELVSLPGEQEEKPKLDPTRLFRKGDIVEMDAHGRDIAASMKRSGVKMGERYTVTEDENNTGYVSFIGDDGIEHHSMFFWLKLVTPVEELEPYSLTHGYRSWHIERDGKVHSQFPYDETVSFCVWKNKEQAKAAAEAECERLNAEWRKEQNNG